VFNPTDYFRDMIYMSDFLNDPVDPALVEQPQQQAPVIGVDSNNGAASVAMPVDTVADQ